MILNLIKRSSVKLFVYHSSTTCLIALFCAAVSSITLACLSSTKRFFTTAITVKNVILSHPYSLNQQLCQQRPLLFSQLVLLAHSLSRAFPELFFLLCRTTLVTLTSVMLQQSLSNHRQSVTNEAYFHSDFPIHTALPAVCILDSMSEFWVVQVIYSVSWYFWLPES